MPSFILKQPNGKFAAFSSVIDNFTAADLTREEALDRCLDRLGRIDAEQKVQRGERDETLRPGMPWPTDGLGRWRHSLRTVALLLGVQALREALSEFDVPPEERDRWVEETVASLPASEVRP